MSKNDEWKGWRVRIRRNWEGAGRLGTAIGEPVFFEQDWVPVKWDDADDPDFHKRAGLLIVDDDEGPWARLRELEAKLQSGTITVGELNRYGDLARQAMPRILAELDTLRETR